MKSFYYSDANFASSLPIKDYDSKSLLELEVKIENISPLPIKNYRPKRQLTVKPENIYENVPRVKRTAEKVEKNRAELQGKLWYHGAITRETAESLLRDPGDFLVRESTSLRGQIVLSCYNGVYIHMTLTDPEGEMRATGFTNVTQLIDFYYLRREPISQLTDYIYYLGNPIISL